MTREQIEIALGAKEVLQKHLDQRFNTLNSLAYDLRSSSKTTEGAIIGNRAEMYNALGLVCATEVGMYKAMLAMEDMKDKP